MKAGWGRGAAATRGSHSHRPPTVSSAGHLKQLDLERRTNTPRPRCGVDFAGCAARAGAVAGRAGSAGWGGSPPVPIPPGRRCCAPGASPRHAAAVGAAGVKAAAARAPPLFASLTAPVVLCRAERQPSRTERRRDGGTRKEERGRRNGDRGTSDEGRAPSSRACPAPRFRFESCVVRHADCAVLRPPSGCRHWATWLHHLVFVVRSACDLIN